MFVNPRAGTFTTRALRRLLADLKAQNSDVKVSYGPTYSVQDADADEIIIMGGDGTVRDAIDAALACGRDPLISVVSAGTVNLLDRELRETDGGDAVHSVHLGLIDQRPILVCASAGPDSHIVAGLAPHLKRWLGRGAYIVAGLWHLLLWRRDEIDLLIDGRELRCAAFWLAKGRYYAGGWSFAPDARVTCGRFHGVALMTGTRLAYLAFLLALITNRIDRLPSVKRFECRTLTIRSKRPMPIQVDGDCIGLSPATITMHAGPIGIRRWSARQERASRTWA